MISKEKPKDFKPKFNVVSCIIECDGEILLLKRSPLKYEGEKWGVVAGKVEKEETDIQAIIREINEETGQTTNPDQVKSFNTFYVDHPWFSFIYHVHSLKLTGKPNIIISPEEHTEYKWVTPGDAIRMNLVLDEDVVIKDFFGI